MGPLTSALWAWAQNWPSAGTTDDANASHDAGHQGTDTAAIGGSLCHGTKCSSRVHRAASSFLVGVPEPSVILNEGDKGPELEQGTPRVRLLYQTPEVYRTNVGTMDKMRNGWKFGCAFQGESSPKHPSIQFNKKVRHLHVHLEDKKTGKVFWDADFKVGLPVIGGTSLNEFMPPVGGEKMLMEYPCVANDDPEPHLFDLSLKTNDLHYHNLTGSPVGDAEGFLNVLGPKAHIGFEVHRLPRISEEPGPNGKLEILGKYTPGGSVSRGPIHQSRHERWLNKEEDPFQSRERDGRGYYYWIVPKKTKSRDSYGYLDPYNPQDGTGGYAPPMVVGRNAMPVQGLEKFELWHYGR
eukprot:gnl/TRDRNA2_/TRDRNA2_126358_c0_seq2.p1 gnl/TRDRNA2_/TRDRNA2_126358_c0~~gnl/TRDRNA2_/TRDRNA2_126358_c0_seq2.p1  ORF type:complete len:352 (-),score=47.03 gnl/TRDRNA2_/TRDRNA2_126358_c0_seq2:241-1296(-)